LHYLLKKIEDSEISGSSKKKKKTQKAKIQKKTNHSACSVQNIGLTHAAFNHCVVLSTDFTQNGIR